MKLPVKVDLAEGADGLELHEIIFSLQYTANAIRPFDLFRARYLEKLVRKYSQIQGQRQNCAVENCHDTRKPVSRSSIALSSRPGSLYLV